ncbi:MAG: hypothetical protein ACYCZK_05085 [Microbacteriaceae bacterium]
MKSTSSIAAVTAIATGIGLTASVVGRARRRRHKNSAQRSRPPEQSPDAPFSAALLGVVGEHRPGDG